VPLPFPVARQHLHSRRINLAGYYRDDGLWDIEAHIVDSKTYSYQNRLRGTVAAGQPVHDMSLRLTLDRHLVIRDVAVGMDAQPYATCSEVLPNFRRLIGLQIGKGWSRKVRAAVGGVEGCTHIMELLHPIATVTFQTMASDYAQQLMGDVAPASGEAPEQQADSIPFMLDGCYSWARSGAVVKEEYPQYYQPETAILVTDRDRKD